MLKSRALLLSLLLLLPAASFGYVVYNQTSYTVSVQDWGGVGGLAQTLAPGQSAACDPNSYGCFGKMQMVVLGKSAGEYCDFACSAPLAYWDQGDRGYYYVITETSTPYPQKGWCQIYLYRDPQ